MLETAASRGWKAKDAIEWFHGIGRLGRVLINRPAVSAFGQSRPWSRHRRMTESDHFGHRAVTLSALCRCYAVISKFRGFPESLCRYRQAYRALPEEKDGRRQSLRATV